MKIAARIATWVGGIALIISLFIHYELTPDGTGYTRWHLDGGESAEWLILTLVIFALVTVTIFADVPLLAVIQAGLSILLCGQAFQIYSHYDGATYGYWIAAVGAVLMVIGGVLGLAAIWSRGGWRSTTGWDSPGHPRRDAAMTSNGSGLAARPGWYGDPAGQAALRYWSGAGWTQEVRQ